MGHYNNRIAIVYDYIIEILIYDIIKMKKSFDAKIKRLKIHNFSDTKTGNTYHMIIRRAVEQLTVGYGSGRHIDGHYCSEAL